MPDVVSGQVSCAAGQGQTDGLVSAPVYYDEWLTFDCLHPHGAAGGVDAPDRCAANVGLSNTLQKLAVRDHPASSVRTSHKHTHTHTHTHTHKQLLSVVVPDPYVCLTMHCCMAVFVQLHQHEYREGHYQPLPSGVCVARFSHSISIQH